MNENFDEELYLELVHETDELIEEILDIFMGIEKDRRLGEKDDYEELMRITHSVKGSVGMLGLQELMESIHNVEDFLKASYLTKDIVTKGVCDLLIDYWSNTKAYLFDNKSSMKLPMSFKDCFDCLQQNNYNSVCKKHFSEDDFCSPENKGKRVLSIVSHAIDIMMPNKDEDLSGIILITDNLQFDNEVREIVPIDRTLDCIDLIYRKKRYLHNLKALVIDCDNYNKNPFLLQYVFTSLSITVPVIYIYSDFVFFLSLLKELDVSPASLVVLNRKSENYEKSFKNLLKLA
ncbi:MAG: hypothetical protein GY909_01235 [Oligoflexia bacterium]|nr:hypothetical protein [Oligoflexia bacterium]